MDIPDGRKAPSPESRRRIGTFSDGDDYRLPSTQADRGNRTNRYPEKSVGRREEDDDTGFMETKPIVVASVGSKSRSLTPPEMRCRETILYRGDAEKDQSGYDEEPRYYGERPRAPKIPLRGVRGSDDQQHDLDFRRHFQRRSPFRKEIQSPARDEQLLQGMKPEQISSPNPLGTNEKIEAWLEELRRSRPRSMNRMAGSHNQSPQHYERLMQVWPADMEGGVLAAERSLADIDCSLEEYVDIVCALIGIPVEENRNEAVHQLFMLYLDLKEIQA